MKEEYSIEHYKQLSFKHFVKSFLISKLLSKVPKIQTKVSRVARSINGLNHQLLRTLTSNQETGGTGGDMFNVAVEVRMVGIRSALRDGLSSVGR